MLNSTVPPREKNNTKNAAQKAALPTMALAHRFHNLLTLHTSIKLRMSLTNTQEKTLDIKYMAVKAK